jgi:hypothetical protein
MSGDDGQDEGDINGLEKFAEQSCGQEIRDRLNTFRELALKEDAVVCRFLGATRLYEMMTFANHENMVALLKPVFVDFLKHPEQKTITDFHEQALEFMTNEWKKLKK